MTKLLVSVMSRNIPDKDLGSLERAYQIVKTDEGYIVAGVATNDAHSETPTVYMGDVSDPHETLKGALEDLMHSVLADYESE